MLQTHSYRREIFNALLSIESASTLMFTDNRLEAALTAFRPIFVRHSMTEFWGISLLHKHFALSENELPVQDTRGNAGHSDLVTRPRNSDFSKPFWPSVLSIARDLSLSVVPLEFSTTEQARKANDRLLQSPEFIEEFCSVAIKNKLSDTFGLIAVPARIPEGAELIEFNYEDRVSVLEVKAIGEYDPANLIQTSWIFSREAEGGKCKSKCLSSCSKGSSGSHTRNHSAYHDPNG